MGLFFIQAGHFGHVGGCSLLCISCGLSISDLRQSHQSGSRIIQHQYPVPPLRIIHFHLSMCKINGNILLETYSKYTQPNNKHMHIYIHIIMHLENLSYKNTATYIYYIYINIIDRYIYIYIIYI
jgi:hypothetical protein